MAVSSNFNRKYSSKGSEASKKSGPTRVSAEQRQAIDHRWARRIRKDVDQAKALDLSPEFVDRHIPAYLAGQYSKAVL